MSVVKVIELMAESEKGWEDAAQNAVTEAAKTVRNIQNLYVKDCKAVVEKDRIVKYRVNAKISFIVD
jgi:hypothetical protein